MGIIKRILKETSLKLLNKLGVQRNEFVLNTRCSGLGLAQVPNAANSIDACANQLAQLKLGTKLRSKSAKPKRSSRKEAAIPEVLLLAAKNYLPPVQFHHVHGPNAQLAKNKFVARRTQSFCQALVFSNRVILPNERVYIKVLEIAKGWSGTIRFGFTSVDPATLRYQMPKHACPDMTNAGHTWARALADEVVHRNSVIHFSYDTNGYIHYGINNQDCGIFHANASINQNLWFIVDIYGLTAAVELIDPRVHNASSELDLSALDDELRSGGFEQGDRLTMFKSTGAMDELLSASNGALRSKRKRISGRKAARQAALLYQQWPHQSTPHGLLMTSPLQFANGQTQGPILPNLSSLILPTAQQNIYSPMPEMTRTRNSRPAASVRPSNDSHDYYQIMTNHGHNNEQQAIRGTELPSCTTLSAGVESRLSGSANQGTFVQAATTLSALNSSPASGYTSSSAYAINGSEEQEICQQSDSFPMSDSNIQLKHKAASKSNKSTVLSTQAPVAAQRRKLQSGQINPSQATNSKQKTSEQSKENSSKITHQAASSSSAHHSNLKSSKISASSTNIKPTKARHLAKNIKASPALRDANNNSPTSKDCPICFERPINCVLYQCGHMCTCYECGVKQWRTQSRTCPICRTVIKDVIKTYLS